MTMFIWCERRRAAASQWAQARSGEQRGRRATPARRTWPPPPAATTTKHRRRAGTVRMSGRGLCKHWHDSGGVVWRRTDVMRSSAMPSVRKVVTHALVRLRTAKGDGDPATGLQCSCWGWCSLSNQINTHTCAHPTIHRTRLDDDRHENYSNNNWKTKELLLLFLLLYILKITNRVALFAPSCNKPRKVRLPVRVKSFFNAPVPEYCVEIASE